MYTGTKADKSLMLWRILTKDSVADMSGAKRQGEADGIGIV